MGQRWVSGYGERTAPTREALCWHCVWTLWTMLSQTVWGFGPINHSVIGPAAVIIHPGPLISPDVKWFVHAPPFFSPLSVWTLSLGICHGCIYRIHLVIKSKLSVLLSVRSESNPLPQWKRLEYLWIKGDFVGTGRARDISSSAMDARRQHINLECTGRSTSGAEREQVAHWGGHAFTMAMMLATGGFFHRVNGKGSGAYSGVSPGHCTCLDPPTPRILCHSGQTKYSNTEKGGIVGKKERRQRKTRWRD